jgi:hypothetical protein
VAITGDFPINQSKCNDITESLLKVTLNIHPVESTNSCKPPKVNTLDFVCIAYTSLYHIILFQIYLPYHYLGISSSILSASENITFFCSYRLLKLGNFYFGQANGWTVSNSERGWYFQKYGKIELLIPN